MKKTKSLITVFGICLLIMAIGVYAVSKPALAQKPASAAEAKKLTLSFWGLLAEPMGKALQEYIAEVDERTKGKVKITIYPGGTLTPGPQAYEGVVAGLSDMAFVLYAYNPGRFPLTMGWSLPLPIQSAKDGTRIFNESLEKFKPKEFADSKLMYFTSTTAAYPLTTKKPIRSVEDFKGLKIRTLGNMALYMKELGAVPISMPIGQLYGALDKGVVEATINNTLTLDHFKFADLIKYMLSWHWGPASAWGLHMNWNVWKSLSPDVQKVFEEANQKYIWKQVEYQDGADKVGLELALSKGMKVIKQSAEMKMEMERRVQPVYDKYVADMEAKGLPGREFLDFLLKRVKELK